MPFARPTLQQLIGRAETDLDSHFPAGALRHSDRAVLARVIAAGAHGLYGHQEFSARQQFPDTAEAEFLERWAAFWLKTPNPKKLAVSATGNVDFTGNNGTDIPAGTALQSGDGAVYTTDALVTIAAGVATAAVTAKEGGAAGDLPAGALLTVVSALPGIDAQGTVAAGGLTGGIDEETDAALLGRVLLRIQQGAPNGKIGDYVQWALENAGVTRAWDFPDYTGLGTVGVTFVLDDKAGTIIPDAGEVATVQAFIDAKRPEPSSVTVFAPVAVNLDLTITLTPNTTAVQDAVKAELEDMLRRDAAPGGTILLSRINEAIALADEETDHVLTLPAANVPHAAGEIAVLGAVTWA